jgi:transcriptional regulator with XRE-family HTH domain
MNRGTTSSQRHALPGSDTPTLRRRGRRTLCRMPSESPIGDFLRARREQVRPEDVGLSDFGRRRVPGLRREELAMLAGVSPDYYVRLEQGRERHPSEQVLDALARALMLTAEATRHLHDLARPALAGGGAGREPNSRVPVWCA